MPSPPGNTNAEKWSQQATIDKLHELDEYVRLAHINTLGMALAKVGLYDGIWPYWKQRWAEHEEIMHTMYWIDQVFISKVVEGALNKRLHAGMAMFILRAKHHMRDKPLQKGEQEPEGKATATPSGPYRPRRRGEKSRRRTSCHQRGNHDHAARKTSRRTQSPDYRKADLRTACAAGQPYPAKGTRHRAASTPE